MRNVADIDGRHVTVLQRVKLDSALDVRELYWRSVHEQGSRAEVRATEDARLVIDATATITFDTYFGGFHEPHWFHYTHLNSIALRLTLNGTAMLRVHRTLRGGDSHLLAECTVSTGTHIITFPPPAAHFRQAGRIHFALTAKMEAAELIAAEWVTAAEPSPVRMTVVFCTFNRVAQIADVLAAIAGDAELSAELHAVIVVNQGTPGLLRRSEFALPRLRLGVRLREVEQNNFGGAGGFGRGILEAQDDAATTHVALLDDDIVLEPESLLRMMRVFAFAKPELCIGGHMLDGIRRTRLYEAGAVVANRNWALEPQLADRELRHWGELNALLDIPPSHYNGWWMFGLPRATLERFGLPLPCFIRGDDVEMGLRLTAAGHFSVPFAGIAVWHEPFYLKIGGWHLYYETRNLLIAVTLHFDYSRAKLVRLLIKRVLIHLLTYRYHNVALMLRAVEDFASGPSVLSRDPRGVHASVQELRRAYPAMTVPRERPVPPATLRRDPRGVAGFWWRMVRVLARNALVPVPRNVAPRLLPVHDLVWFRLHGLDCLAADTYWDRDVPVFRRSRAEFLRLCGRAVAGLLRLAMRAERVRAEWKAAAPRLTSEPFWRGYLGLRRSPRAADAVTACPPAA